MSDPSPTTFSLATFKHKKDNIPVQHQVDMAGLVELLTHHAIRPDKDGWLFSPVHYSVLARGNANVEAVSCLVFDFDKGTIPAQYEERWRGYGYIVYSTWRHSPEQPRWRVVFPLLAPVPAEQWSAVWRKLAHYLTDDQADPNCKDPSRIYYLPAVPQGREADAFSYVHDGVLLDHSRFPELKQKERKNVPLPSGGSGQVAMEILLQRALKKVAAGDGRHNSGFWLACQCRDNRYDAEETLACPFPLLVPPTNTTGEFEPYTQERWAADVRDAYSKAPRDPWAGKAVESAGSDIIEGLDPLDPAAGIPDYPMTDTGNAERLVYRYGHLLRYCAVWKSWLLWDGRRWKVDEGNVVVRLAVDTVRSIIDEAKRHVGEGGKQEALLKWSHRCEGAQKLDSMIKIARSLRGVAIHADSLDSDPLRLNFANGTLNLRSGRLEPHSIVDYNSKMLPVEFDAYASCELWERFLERIMGDDLEAVAFIQRACGYSLTGLTSEQCMFFMHGGGSNGKSTFIETLLYCLGEYGRRTPAETILAMRSGNNDRPSNDIAALRGRRVVVPSEIEDNTKLREGLIKDLTGGDKISARYLFREYEEFTPQLKLWMYGNHKPRIVGQDHGIWRRIRLIPFNVTIPEGERDTELLSKLRAEAPGIVAWMARGYTQWRREGLSPPAVVVQATQSYRTDQDVLREWIEDCCVLGETVSTSRKFLYGSYSGWCDENGLVPMSSRRLAEQLTERFGVTQGPKMHGGVRHWSGIGLGNGGL